MKVFLISIMSFLMGLSVYAKPTSSLYENQTLWNDQNNREIKLSQFKDNFVIIAMVYTGCAHACPLTISKIQEIERDFIKDKIQNYKIVLASFDVKKDKPDHLKKYMEEKKLDPNHWTFLSASSDSSARELSVILGVSYKELEDGEFSHSNVLTMLDKDGKVIHKVDNLNADLKEFKTKLNENLKSHQEI